MVVAVIFVTVFIEMITHHVDHVAEHTPYIFQIVQRVYKELMLLGIISFGLFLIESNICMPADILHDLHTVHILIFYMSIAYIVEALFILYVAGLVARRWAKIENITLMEYATLKLKRAAIETRLKQQGLYRWLSPLSWSLMWRLHGIREKAAYQDTRLQFISCNRLPHNFAFNVYLKRCIRQVFVDLLHIHSGIWLAVIMIVQLDLFIQTSFINPQRLANANAQGEIPPSPIRFIQYCIFFGAVAVLWLASIYYKVLHVQDACFSSELMEFNVWEELRWMMRQQKLARSKSEHQTQRRFLGKIKKQKTQTLFGGGSPKPMRKRGSIMGFFGGVAPDPHALAKGGPPTTTALCSTAAGGGAALGGGSGPDTPSSLLSQRRTPSTPFLLQQAQQDEDTLMQQLQAQAYKKDDQMITSMQKRRASVWTSKQGNDRNSHSNGNSFTHGRERGASAAAAATPGGGGSPGGGSPSAVVGRGSGGHGAHGANGAHGGHSGHSGHSGHGLCSHMGIRRGSIKTGAEAQHITPDQYLEHVEAIQAAWRYACTQVIHDIRLTKRLKKQKKFGHFSIEQWGRTSRVFQKFFWFHSHLFIQYFLQGAVFCTAIYLALVGNFGGQYLFTEQNVEERLSQVVLLIVVLILMFTVGLFTLVPSILMQYTMVMHLSQLHDKKIIVDAVEAAKPKNLTTREKREAAERAEEAKRFGPWYSCSREKLDHLLNSSRVVHTFLLLLIIDFFISVLAAVVRDDRRVFILEYEALYNVSDYGAPGHEGHLATRDEMEDLALMLERISLGIAYVFCVEVILRFGVAPSSFAASPWDIFDALIVFSYAIALPLLEGQSEHEDALGMVVLLRVLRVLRFHRFMYAMGTGGHATGGSESRREQLAEFCKTHFLCWCRRRDDERVPSDLEMPKCDLGEDPIAAMKAKRAAARAAAEGGGQGGAGAAGNAQATASASLDA